MGRKYKRHVLLSLAVVILTGVIIGYKLWNKPHEDIKNASAIRINAMALYHTLANDSSHTPSSFINQVLVVSGKVKHVSENRQKQQVILLETNVPDGSVNCTMEENVRNVKAGDSILLKGICMGYTGGDQDIQLPGDVFLIRCYHSF
jgi:3-deoxy-D-arabino-heptulosonate 7-phosphate (DAHP) synthase